MSTTIDVRPITASAVLRHGRIRLDSLFFALCMASTAVAFVLYYAVWKYRLLLAGWVMCWALFAVFWSRDAVGVRLRPGVILPVVAFYLYLWTTTLWSYDATFTVRWAAFDLLFPAVFLLSLIWAENVSSWQLAYYFELMVTLSSIVIVFFVLTTGTLIDESLGAVRTGMAFTFIAALPFLIWRARTHRSGFRFALVAWVVVFILASGSRSALLLLPLAVAGSTFIAVRSSDTPIRSTFVVAAALPVVFALALSFTPVRSALAEGLARFSPEQYSLDISEQVLRDLEGPPRARIDIDRRLQAYVALETFLERPILGHGYMNVYAKMQDRFGRDVSAHGLPFTLLAETGVAGTLLFVLLVGRFFRACGKARAFATTREERDFASTARLTMIIMLVFGLFHQLHQSPAFFILLGWGYAFDHVHNGQRHGSGALHTRGTA